MSTKCLKTPHLHHARPTFSLNLAKLETKICGPCAHAATAEHEGSPSSPSRPLQGHSPDLSRSIPNHAAFPHAPPPKITGAKTTPPPAQQKSRKHWPASLRGKTPASKSPPTHSMVARAHCRTTPENPNPLQEWTTRDPSLNIQTEDETTAKT